MILGQLSAGTTWSVDPSAGASPYSITGNPVEALIAQLNRFAGKSVKPPGSRCGTRRYVGAPFPIIPTLSEDAAFRANSIMADRASCVSDERLIDFKKYNAIIEGGKTPWTWAMNDLANITTQIAQFADSMGLDPAPVGITQRDPKIPMPSKIPYLTIALVVLAIGGGAAYVYTQKMRGAR